MKSTLFGVFEDFKFKISEDYKQSLILAETANMAEAGKLQFWSELSVLNLRSSNIPETVDFTPP